MISKAALTMLRNLLQLRSEFRASVVPADNAKLERTNDTFCFKNTPPHRQAVFLLSQIQIFKN